MENLFLILFKYFVYKCRENPSKLIINTFLDYIRYIEKVKQRSASSVVKTELHMSKWESLLTLI